MNFSDRLRSERNRLGYSQDAFASLGGVKKNAQGLYERGVRFPDAAYLMGVARAGVDVKFLLMGKEDSDELQKGIDAIPVDVAELILRCNDLVQEQCVQAGFVMDIGKRCALATTMAHGVIKDFGFDFDKARPYLAPIVQVSIAHQRTTAK